MTSDSARINSSMIPLGANPIARAAHRRTDAEWLENALKQEDVLIFLMKDGLPLLQGDAIGSIPRGERPPTETRSLVWLGPEAMRFADGALPIFLGEDKNTTPVFALALPNHFEIQGSLLEGSGAFEDMRVAAASLPALESNLASTARSLSLWHESHGFCAKCGAPTKVGEAGWKRTCPTCGTEHFPRTDPVVIMLPIKDDKCLLGRSPGWPEGFWSSLAGFVEPGETIEQAAAREVFEESGVTCDVEAAKYLFCQPWPFPSSLMMGLHLPALSDDITIDPNEIEDARWFTRSEIFEMMDGTHPSLYMPPPLAIAHYVIKAWVER